MKTLIMLYALLASCAAAQSFVQGATAVTVSSVAVTGEAPGFNLMVCARSSDAGVADLRIRGEVTLTDFQVVTFDQIFTRKTGTEAGVWKHATCAIVATADAPAVQVTGLAVTPTRADPVIVFVPITRKAE